MTTDTFVDEPEGTPVLVVTTTLTTGKWHEPNFWRFVEPTYVKQPDGSLTILDSENRPVAEFGAGQWVSITRYLEAKPRAPRLPLSDQVS